MVWIHGGAFAVGSGNAFLYGPDHLVGAGVVLVTLNYRLGALGFLSLENEEVSGNMGLKVNYNLWKNYRKEFVLVVTEKKCCLHFNIRCIRHPSFRYTY